MTATLNPPFGTSTDSLLRFAMRLDATLTGLIGLAMAAFAGPVSEFTGLTATQEFATGAAFVLYGVVVYLLAGVRNVRGFGIGIVVANVLCTVAAIEVVTSGILPLTNLGVISMLGTGVYTAAFAVLQYLGVRRLA
jgi:hypothetical protein